MAGKERVKLLTSFGLASPREAELTRQAPVSRLGSAGPRGIA